jgi:uncharacterized glyoxalase superfamily protein PhnB
MPANPPENIPRILSNIVYDDPGAALDWLAAHFGFVTRMKMPGPDGVIMHAEMNVEDSVIMLSPAMSAEEWASPRSLGGKVTQGLYIYVDDLDAHCQRARAAGAKILFDPEDMFWGDRTYVAADLEGHRWTFANHNRDVAPEDMHP